jgi:hypothetical protein
MGNPNGTLKNLTPFRPGQTGNPGGKPAGARNRIQGKFLRTLADDFDKYGEGAIVACREETPAHYLRIVASLVPKQAEQLRPLDSKTDEELEAVFGYLKAHVVDTDEPSESETCDLLSATSRSQGHG